MKKRTDVDFGKHVLTVSKYLSPGVLIHDLALPNSVYHRVCFVNTCGICCVTGDFLNWVFNRPFNPEESVEFGDEYFVGKLSMGNTYRAGMEYRPDKTEEYIRQLLKNTPKHDYTESHYATLMDYYRGLLTIVHEKERYKELAYGMMPGFMDSESIPYVEDIPYQLKVVLDAFHEIHNRIGEGNFITR